MTPSEIKKIAEEYAKELFPKDYPLMQRGECDLEKQAIDYAKTRLAKQEGISIWRSDVSRLIKQAYEQGWVDRGRKDFNDEIAKRSDFAPDCTYFDCGDCRKGLPDTSCELSKCVAYTPKSEKK